MIPLLLASSLCLSVPGPSTPACAPQGPGAAPPRVLEFAPLAPFCEPPVPLPRVPFGSMLSIEAEDDHEPLVGQPHHAQFEVDVVQGILGAAFPAIFESETFEARPAAGGLELVGAPETLQQVRTDLRALLASLGRPIELELLVVPLRDDALPATVLNGNEAAQWLAGQTVAMRARTVTRSSRPVSFDRLQWQRYLRDVNVEVAQKIDLAWGDVDAFAKGLRVRVAPHALVDSEDLALFVQFSCAQPVGPNPSMSTNVTGHPNVEQPVLASAYGAVSGRVTSGGALVVPLGGDARGGLRTALVLRARHPEPRPTSESGLAALPISALTTSSCNRRPVPGSLRPQRRDEMAEAWHEGMDYEWMDQDRLQDILASSLPGGGEDVLIACEGGYVFVRGNRATVAQVADTIAKLQERMLRNVELRCTVRMTEAEGDSVFAATRQDGAVFALHDVAMPCLTGHVAAVFRGIERTAVRTLMPEIAQEASGLDVVVDERRGGLWMSARPMIADDRVLPALHVQVGVQEEPTTRSMPRGAIQLGATAATTAWFENPLAPGHPVEFAAGPDAAIDSRSYRGAISVTAGLPGAAK